MDSGWRVSEDQAGGLRAGCTDDGNGMLAECRRERTASHNKCGISGGTVLNAGS